MHAAEGPTCCNHPLKHKFACCSPPRPTFGACSLFSTVTLDRDTCTQRPTCSQQPATGSQVAGGKHSNTYRTTPYHTTSMDINQDRAYDLDLQSLLPPTPGAQGSVPAAHIDGWLGHVEPGGLRHDEIAVLGTRTSTVRHHGGSHLSIKKYQYRNRLCEWARRLRLRASARNDWRNDWGPSIRLCQCHHTYLVKCDGTSAGIHSNNVFKRP
jgi:hypothetical protein